MSILKKLLLLLVFTVALVVGISLTVHYSYDKRLYSQQVHSQLQRQGFALKTELVTVLKNGSASDLRRELVSQENLFEETEIVVFNGSKLLGSSLTLPPSAELSEHLRTTGVDANQILDANKSRINFFHLGDLHIALIPICMSPMTYSEYFKDLERCTSALLVKSVKQKMSELQRLYFKITLIDGVIATLVTMLMALVSVNYWRRRTEPTFDFLRRFRIGAGNSKIVNSYNDELSLLEGQINNLIERTSREQSFSVALIDKSTAIILTEDKDFKIMSCSEAWSKTTGYTREETIGRDFIEFMMPEHQLKARTVREKFFDKTFEERSYAVDIVDKAGDIVSLNLNVRQDLIGVDARVILTANDITGIAKARQQAEDYLRAGTGLFVIQNDRFETLYVSEKVFDFFSKDQVNLINEGDSSLLQKVWLDFDHSYWFRHKAEVNALEMGKIWESPEPERILKSSGEERYIIRTRRWFASYNSDRKAAFSNQKWISTNTVTTSRFNEGRLLYTAFQDVTDLYVEREFTQSLIERSSALIMTQTKDGTIHSVSQAFVDLMGYDRDALVGKDLIDFYHPEDQVAGAAERKKFQEARKQEITIERRLIDANSQTKTFILNVRASSVKSVYESILTLSDITALKAAEEKLRHQVERDELTGIYTRRGMKHRFGSDQRSEDCGMYLIDLDHFKFVNDGYGHDAGDMLLKATANVLERQTRSEGSCFRLGGEEFMVLRPWRGWKDAYDFSEKLRELIGATSIESGSRSVQRTASIGVSYLSQNGSTSEALKLSDMALREAKERGRDCCVFADDETLADFEDRGVFIQASEVQFALERGEMEYFVQPIVGGSEHSIIGFEALIRWFLPSGELIGPIKFVDVLYQVIRQPRYAQLKLDLRRQVLQQLKDYPEQYTSFNFTLEQIGYLGAARALHRDIQSILDHANRQIVIELSEKALHARVNEDVLIGELSQLRAFGYKIALDDFGIESSNIQRLQNFPIDIVKIDRSLISEVTNSESTRKLVGSLAALLKSLELSVIVEGIETQEQADILNNFGLTNHQGYHYSKPVPPGEVLSLVAK